MTERILVRLPNHLGDVLMARPLLAALARARPEAEVCTVAPGPLHALLAAERSAGRRVDWPGPGPGRAAALAAVRAWRPDAALVLPPSFSSAWFAWRAGARVRVGFRGEGRGGLLTHALRRLPRGDRHLAEEFLALGEPLGIPGTLEPVPALPLPEGAGREAETTVAGTPAAEGAGFALLGPGAIYGPAKRWPAERFAAVGTALAARGLAVLVAGTESERAVCEEVATRIGPRAASVAGRTSLTALAGLTARAVVAVCNDSGLAHLAAACGTPTVAVFGSTSSAWTAPLGARVAVVQHPPVCAPCFARTCRVGYRCLEAVTTREVLVACDGVGLAGRAA